MNSRGVTRWWCLSTHRRGVTCEMVKVVIHREGRGDTMTEERSDMTTMVVPTQIFLTRNV